tara:strand:- start:127 stop:570 length:444 start_codon:yes stop_codon:yes gene_type:complete
MVLRVVLLVVLQEEMVLQMPQHKQVSPVIRELMVSAMLAVLELTVILRHIQVLVVVVQVVQVFTTMLLVGMVVLVVSEGHTVSQGPLYIMLVVVVVMYKTVVMAIPVLEVMVVEVLVVIGRLIQMVLEQTEQLILAAGAAVIGIMQR